MHESLQGDILAIIWGTRLLSIAEQAFLGFRRAGCPRVHARCGTANGGLDSPAPHDNKIRGRVFYCRVTPRRQVEELFGSVSIVLWRTRRELRAAGLSNLA